MNEFELISHIRARFRHHELLALPIGDDACWFPNLDTDLVSTDTLVEGIHFSRSYAKPLDVGWRLIAANLSDICAMGGTPRLILLSCSLPVDLAGDWMLQVIDGMVEACDTLLPKECPLPLGGGDTTQTRGPAVLTLTILGTAPKRGPLTRTGANEGDQVILFGPVGSSAAGLAVLEYPELVSNFKGLISCHLRPRPNVGLGIALGESGLLSGLIDISDGLGQDLQHLLASGGFGATIRYEDIPKDQELLTLASELNQTEYDWVIGGGEDFVLLGTVPVSLVESVRTLASAHNGIAYPIGEITKMGQPLRFVTSDGSSVIPANMGYQHFA